MLPLIDAPMSCTVIVSLNSKTVQLPLLPDKVHSHKLANDLLCTGFGSKDSSQRADSCFKPGLPLQRGDICRRRCGRRRRAVVRVVVCQCGYSGLEVDLREVGVALGMEDVQGVCVAHSDTQAGSNVTNPEGR